MSHDPNATVIKFKPLTERQMTVAENAHFKETISNGSLSYPDRIYQLKRQGLHIKYLIESQDAYGVYIVETFNEFEDKFLQLALDLKLELGLKDNEINELMEDSWWGGMARLENLQLHNILSTLLGLDINYERSSIEYQMQSENFQKKYSEMDKHLKHLIAEVGRQVALNGPKA